MRFLPAAATLAAFAASFSLGAAPAAAALASGAVAPDFSTRGAAAASG